MTKFLQYLDTPCIFKKNLFCKVHRCIYQQKDNCMSFSLLFISWEYFVYFWSCFIIRDSIYHSSTNFWPFKKNLFCKVHRCIYQQKDSCISFSLLSISWEYFVYFWSCFIIRDNIYHSSPNFWPPLAQIFKQIKPFSQATYANSLENHWNSPV